MKYTKYIKYSILALILTIAIIILVDKVREGFRLNAESAQNDLPSTYTIDAEDSLLFNSRYVNKLGVYENVYSKVRNKISFLYVDSLYHLVICKINSKKEAKLKDLLSVTSESVDRSNGQSYNIKAFNDFSLFQWRGMRPEETKRIYFTLSGDSIQKVASNDSIVSYHLLCKNFSIRYSKDGPIDIYMKGREKGFGFTDITPSDLLFYKKGAFVYFFVMTSNSPKASIPPKILFDMLRI